MACVDKTWRDIYAPNPCTDKAVDDKNSYAHLICHEMAHTNGWRHG
jgi:hypothetical protein